MSAPSNSISFRFSLPTSAQLNSPPGGGELFPAMGSDVRHQGGTLFRRFRHPGHRRAVILEARRVLERLLGGAHDRIPSIIVLGLELNRAGRDRHVLFTHA